MSLPVRALGSGSNVILKRYLDGLIIHVGLLGRSVVDETADDVVVRIGAGENWHETVLWAHENGYYGLENLALIPGSVGASPIQNIGAYGAELSDVIERIEVVHSGSLTTRSLLPSDCQFAYRDSIFKTEKGRDWLITAVDMKLSKTPTLNLSYPALEVAISSSEKSPQALLRAVIAIRKAKLPDPAEQPNVGSYFKNPIVTREKADALGARYPNLPQYSARGGAVKLSAAWMIDHLGWRGKGGHGALVAKQHALVVINKSAKYASQIIEFADEIARSVEAEFGVALEREPQVLGSDTPV